MGRVVQDGLKRRWGLGLLGVGVLAACATATQTLSGPQIEPRTTPWRAAAESSALYSASCPNGQSSLAPEAITIDSSRIASSHADFVGRPGVKMDGLEFVAGYHLTSNNPRFGGLSGLAVMEWGKLLLVSDQGDFVWLTLDQETAAAPLSGAIAAMRGANGAPLSGKMDADAEGLTLSNGLALVSFERNHRIEAFDLRTCGAAARASLVAPISAFDQTPRMSENGGAEALALSPDGGLMAGLETDVYDDAAISMPGAAPYAAFTARLKQDRSHRLTGMDVISERDGDAVFTVHRAYNPLTGTRIMLKRTALSQDSRTWSLGDSRTLLKLNLPGPVDNFEGVAATQTPEGHTRLYLIADDNFSEAQRTLFYIFDVKSAGE